LYFAQGHNAGGDLTSESRNKGENEARASGSSYKNYHLLDHSISSKTDFHHRLFDHFVGAKLGHDGKVRSSARYLPITERRIAITPASEHEGDGDYE
jgi:hypothetical protein